MTFKFNCYSPLFLKVLIFYTYLLETFLSFKFNLFLKKDKKYKSKLYFSKSKQLEITFHFLIQNFV